MSVVEHCYSHRTEMLDALYEAIVSTLGQSLQQQNRATLLLSGGSTPAPLYRKLSSADLDWHRVNVALVDERWVETDSSASNERLVRETLLQGKAKAAHFAGMKSHHLTPFDAEAACNTRYATFPLPHSIALLGMGLDSHTASLFPHTKGLAGIVDSTQHCAAIKAAPSSVTGEHLERMTMTPWSLQQSQKLILLMTGNEKWTTYLQAKASVPSIEKPVSLFIHQKATPLHVYWAP